MAKLLDINPEYLKFWRSGHIAMPANMKLRLQTHTGLLTAVEQIARPYDRVVHDRLVARDKVRLGKLI
jgi:hypothetical protein